MAREKALLFALFTVAALGCSAHNQGYDATTADGDVAMVTDSDSSTDVLSDALDVPLDAGVDVAADTAMDTGHDTGVVIDTGMDTGIDTGIDVATDSALPPTVHLRIQYEARADPAPVDFYFKVLRPDGSTLLDWTHGRCIGGVRSVSVMDGRVNVVECGFDPVGLPWDTITGLPVHSIVKFHPTYEVYPDGGFRPVCPTSGSPPCPAEYPFRYTVYFGATTHSLRPPSSMNLGYGPDSTCGEQTPEYWFLL